MIWLFKDSVGEVAWKCSLYKYVTLWEERVLQCYHVQADVKRLSILQLRPTPLGFHNSSDQISTVLAHNHPVSPLLLTWPLQGVHKELCSAERESNSNGLHPKPHSLPRPGQHSPRVGGRKRENQTCLCFFFFFFLHGAKLRCSRVGLAIWEKYVGRKNAGREAGLPSSGTAFLRRQARPPFPAQLEFIFLKSLPHFPCRNYQIFCF